MPTQETKQAPKQEAPKPTPVELANKHLDTVQEYFSKPEWLKPGFNPHFALQAIAKLKTALAKSNVSEETIKSALDIKAEPPKIEAIVFDIYRK